MLASAIPFPFFQLTGWVADLQEVERETRALISAKETGCKLGVEEGDDCLLFCLTFRRKFLHPPFFWWQ